MIRQLQVLDTLNIAKAKIVEGGSFYLKEQFGTYYTANDTIGQYMFYHLPLKNVILPESVVQIDANAFDGSSSLEKVTVGANTKALGNSVFSGCGQLTDVVLPEGLQTIGDFCFSQCSALSELPLPESLTTIGDYVFYFCMNLNNLSLPQNLKSIGNHAFFNCTKFTEVTIPASVTEIGGCAFDRCPNLAAINVNADNKTYASADGILFDKPFTTVIRCPVGKKISTYTFPETVRIIAPYSFYETALESIEIPDEVHTVGMAAFTSCESLTKAKLPANMTEIPAELFSMSYALAEVNIPEKVVSIGKEAFMACALTEVILPEGLKQLVEAAFFSNKNLQKVTLPSTLTLIENSVFYGDESLKEITSFAAVPPTLIEPASVFDEVNVSEVTLTVPAGSVDSYKAAEGWKDFNIKADVSGINEIEPVETVQPESYYEISGRSIKNPANGIFIVRSADGTVSKQIIK